MHAPLTLLARTTFKMAAMHANGCHAQTLTWQTHNGNITV
jgi:hypothetical protein